MDSHYFKKLVFIIICFCVLMPVLPGCKANAADKQDYERYNDKLFNVKNFHKVYQQGDIETSIRLLNLWQPAAEWKNQFYRHAYKVLDTSINAKYSQLASDAGIIEILSNQNLTHIAGPMLGAVRSDGINIWVRTIKTAKVSVEVQIDESWKMFGPVQSKICNDLVAVVTIDNLEPAKEYSYRVLIDGQPIDERERIFTTAPQESIKSKVKIAFGTCYHRWGLGNYKLTQAILQRKPAAMLLLGDIAVQDRMNHCGMHRADYLLRDMIPAWQNLTESIPVYATWDDHDYFGNDLYGIPEGFTHRDRQNVCKVFKNCWNNPQYFTGKEGLGIYFRTRIGPCDIIMLDNRTFRTSQVGQFLGKQQMQWLKEQLLDCKGPFIILSCGTMWSDYVSYGKDSWAVHDPIGREKLFEFIEFHRIPGVLLVSGDRHGARAFKIPRPCGFNFYEFEPASLGGRSGSPPAKLPNCENQLYGTKGVYAFGEFAFDVFPEDPTVTFRLIKETGDILYELELKQSMLSPPERK